MADGASGEGEPSDKVYEAVDAPASFKSDVRKCFGNEKGEKVHFC